MLEGKVFVVYVRDIDELGLYAMAEKIPRSYNLIGYIKDCTTFNVCNTWKDAQRLAGFWNECYRKNGKQKIV